MCGGQNKADSNLKLSSNFISCVTSEQWLSLLNCNLLLWAADTSIFVDHSKNLTRPCPRNPPEWDIAARCRVHLCHCAFRAAVFLPDFAFPRTAGWTRGPGEAGTAVPRSCRPFFLAIPAPCRWRLYKRPVGDVQTPGAFRLLLPNCRTSSFSSSPSRQCRNLAHGSPRPGTPRVPFCGL